MKKLPAVRTSDIVIQNLNNEILIYDLKNHQAYHLNETSAAIYQSCNGNTTFDELKNRTEFTDELIFLALDQFKAQNLLVESENYSSVFEGLSRREVIRKIGLSTITVLPLVLSITAPTPAAAASSCPSINPCNPAITIPRGCPCEQNNCSNCNGVCDSSQTPSICV